MRRPKPVIVFLMQTVTMGSIAMELRPVILQPVVDRAVHPALMMENSAMALKVAMRTLISV
jgi:hypothetical protein